MEILQAISLDFGRDTHPITVFAKQYDKESRFIEIKPLNCGQAYTLESGVTARLQLTKPDGHTVINNATITSGTIRAELTAQALAADGTAVAEIGLYKGSALLSSQVFYIDIKKAAYDSEAPTSSDEYNALVEALGQVNGSLGSMAAAISDAQTATAAANTAASGANTAKTAANNAASSANTAASGANTAKTAANNAASAANTAADNATAAATAANNAATAAAGAEKVNISAEQTPTGATITVTNREGTETSVHIDTLTAVNTWEDIKNAVRLGLGASLFPVGYEFETLDSDTGKTLIWVVRGHDHHTPENNKLTHSMTLELKTVYSQASGTYKTIQFDAPEALLYAENGLSAGTYCFTWNYVTGSMVAGTYQFTLTQAVPAGGQVVLGTNSSSTAITSCKIATYATPGATTAIENNITVTAGSEGTSLGTIEAATAVGAGLNCAQRIMWGSNNYAQSGLRQWLNSEKAAGTTWTATNGFDRRASWDAGSNGFMHGLPDDFLAVVQAAVLPCRTNSYMEAKSLDGTEFAINQVYSVSDKFFVLSRPEIWGNWDNAAIKDGTQLEYYEDITTNTERIKRDAAGSARYAWLRSPIPGYASYERIVDTGGSLSSGHALNAHGVAPACIIA